MTKNFYLIFGVLWGMLLFSCDSEDKNVSQIISLTHDGDYAISAKAISIDRKQFRDIREGLFPLITTDKSDTIAVQLDDINGDGIWDELFFVMDFEPKSSRQLDIYWQEERIEYEKKVNIRFGVRASYDDVVKPATSDVFYANQLPGVTGYQPYQTDGPSWENDLVGFRHYLDGRNSKDVFGKKIRTLSPDNVGINEAGVTEDDYHVMEDWGRDILSVGNSVGIGGFGLLIGDQLHRLGVTEQDSINNVETTHYEILSNGPVRALMQYNYNNWKPENINRTYQVKEVTSIWPGMHAYKNTVIFPHLEGDEKMVIGLVNSRTDKPLRKVESDDFLIFYTHDKQTYEKEWYLGLALIIPKASFSRQWEAPKSGSLSQTYLVEQNIKAGEPISYYAVASWELSDPGFIDEAFFKDYLESLTKSIEADIKVEILNNI